MLERLLKQSFPAASHRAVVSPWRRLKKMLIRHTWNAKMWRCPSFAETGACRHLNSGWITRLFVFTSWVLAGTCLTGLFINLVCDWQAIPDSRLKMSLLQIKKKTNSEKYYFFGWMSPWEASWECVANRGWCWEARQHVLVVLKLIMLQRLLRFDRSTIKNLRQRTL